MKPDWTDPPWRPWHTCLIGSSHQRELKNCQDATIVREGSRLRARTAIATGRYVIGAVSDGVGSHRYSEVGARVTATLAANIAADGLHRGETVDQLEARLLREVPAKLGRLAEICRDEWTECCYATLVLAVGTIDWFAVWGCGDGYYSVNGETPKCTGVIARDRLPVDYRFAAVAGEVRPPMLTRLTARPASEVRGAWISTDGARYLTSNGKAWLDYLGEPLPDAPPVLDGWQEMESWGQGLYEEARGGWSDRLKDDLGLVAFVPREAR